MLTIGETMGSGAESAGSGWSYEVQKANPPSLVTFPTHSFTWSSSARHERTGAKLNSRARGITFPHQILA